ncbi:MAG: thioredoxin family protein [Phycisphaeraceae bacterium]|nr:thioredoxin family protein [Phycisphaeraceae bacterium]MCW5755134.1 thioredoxin family protein [Phycisphaeraceae bacterium]
MAMASNMLPLGTPAPDFRLLDVVSGRTVALADFTEAKALLVMFICNHCPFVKHIRDELARLGRDYLPQGVAIVAVNSNDIARYPDDAPDKMAAEARLAGYTFPYLFDETQQVAKAYAAACTPDFFLFAPGKPWKLAYRGQLDDSRPNSGTPVTGRDLRNALDAVLSGASPTQEQHPSIGCGIKWKPGNEPSPTN